MAGDRKREPNPKVSRFATWVTAATACVIERIGISDLLQFKRASLREGAEKQVAPVRCAGDAIIGSTQPLTAEAERRSIDIPVLDGIAGFIVGVIRIVGGAVHAVDGLEDEHRRRL